MRERGSGRGRPPHRPPGARPSRPARRPARPASAARPRSPSSSLARIDPLPPSARPSPPRAARPVPALREGPFRVPISTVDWLVGKESLPARYVALRDLLARPAKDLELRKARQALRGDQYLRDALSQLRSRLAREWSAEDLARRYDGGYWRT